MPWMQALPDALAESDSVETIGFDLDATLAEKWEAEWLNGAPEMLQRLAKQGRRVVVATNQGGVACGVAGWGDQYPSPADIVRRFETLEADLPEGVDVEWRVSIYYPDALEEDALQSVAQRVETLGEQAGLEIRCYPEEAARKPGAAMLQDCDVFVGDRDSDVEAAREANVSGLRGRVARGSV
jgi:histidinol phosphatase-like enzyme